MRQCIQIFINTLKIIAIIIAIFFVYFLVINWGDEDLKPAVIKALDWQAPINTFDDNGYLVLWGMDAPITKDAAQVGKKTLQTELSRFASMQKTHKEPAPFVVNTTEIDDYIDWKANQCDYQKQQNCVDFYLQQGADTLILVLKAQQRLATRFNAIKHSKHYVEVVPPMIAAGIPKYQLLTQASELERIRAINDIAENRMEIGLQVYIDNALFSRMLLEKSTSLISHMVALAMMQRDTRMLSELMGKYPQIAALYAAQLTPILAPISMPQYNLKKALLQECAMGYQLFEQLKYASAQALIGSASFLKNIPAKIGYSANATNNMALARCDSKITMAESNVQLFDVAKAADYQAVSALTDVVNVRLLTKKNPVGSILLAVAEPDFASYIERQHDLDGYLTMVKMQLHVLADEADKNRVVDIEIHDGYTQKLMQYDVNTGVVTFIGRQPSNTNFNKSNVYQVKMH